MYKRGSKFVQRGECTTEATACLENERFNILVLFVRKQPDVVQYSVIWVHKHCVPLSSEQFTDYTNSENYFLCVSCVRGGTQEFDYERSLARYVSLFTHIVCSIILVPLQYSMT